MKRWLYVFFGMLFAGYLPAQVTSGAISGTVKDSVGAPVTNAVVTVEFLPTQQIITSRPQADGRFFVSNLRPGGPYVVRVNAIGYKPAGQRDIAVFLGKTTPTEFVLERVVLQLSAVQVTTDASDEARKENVDVQVNGDKMLVLPTLSRSLQDMTRLSSQGNGVSFAGTNYRYNNLTIDGAASNDAFGFSQSSGQSTASVPTGTPGSLSRTQPISLDAIDQISVSIAPYDVKIGNFVGGSINAVTRAGTNTREGSLYSFGRQHTFVGNGLSGKFPNTFREYQLGGRVGGALIKNKVFYFGNVEISRRNDPILFAPGTAGTALSQQIAQQVRDSLVTYAARGGLPNYDPGTIGAYTIPANSEKYFGRIDWNIGTSILTLRNNFVNASAGNLERGQLLNKLSSQDFTHFSKNNSTVVEIKSQFRDNVSNSLLFGISTVADHRVQYGTLFPQIEIQDIQYGQINAGTDREGAVYRQTTRTVELTDNLTWTLGRNTVTLGTHNEGYNVQYTFLNAYTGRWQYPNLTAFFKNQPNRIRASLGDPATPGANFYVVAPSAYVQNEFALTETFKLSFGARMDGVFTETAEQSAAFKSLRLTDGSLPFAPYTNDYGRSIFISPRLGLVWNVTSHMDVRGGTGTFQGRMPFAWFAYPFLQNGSTTRNVDFRPTYTNTFTQVPLLPTPAQQATINTLYNQGTVYEINLIDNQYVQPRVWRSNLAVDLKLPRNTTVTVDGTYTETLQDILFVNVGLPSAAGRLGGIDTRSIYTTTRLPTTTTNPYSAVYLLTNTSNGYRYNITTNLNTKPTGWTDILLSYTYGQSKDVANGQRNSFQSNVEYNQLVEANTYPLTWSNFDVRHRLVGAFTATYNKTTLSLVYTGNSGTPFSYVYSGDLNGDGSSNNDLIYIPRSATDIKLIPSARPSGQADTRSAADIWNDLNAFIESDPYLRAHRGQYAERNGARTPWNHRTDLRATQQIKNLQLTFDIQNFGNLIYSQWGKFYFVPNLNNQNVYPIQYRSGRSVNGVPSFSFDPLKTTYQIDDVLSRWQMQLGMRILF